MALGWLPFTLGFHLFLSIKLMSKDCKNLVANKKRKSLHFQGAALSSMPLLYVILDGIIYFSLTITAKIHRSLYSYTDCFIFKLMLLKLSAFTQNWGHSHQRGSVSLQSQNIFENMSAPKLSGQRTNRKLQPRTFKGSFLRCLTFIHVYGLSIVSQKAYRQNSRGDVKNSTDI